MTPISNIDTNENGPVGAKTRIVGIDLLRCIAMLMVVGLHYLGKGELLPDMSMSSNWTAMGIVSWFLEAVCIVAVNLYMLASGYFLSASSPKLSRLISLYFQIWFYSFGVGMVMQLLHLVPADDINTYNLLTMLLPVSMSHYWFMTAYMFFYMLLPVLCIAVKNMTKSQHQVVLVVLLLFCTILKSVLPVVLENDAKGYDFLWYVVMFLIAAYIRKYNPSFVNKKSAFILYFIGLFGSFAEVLVLGKLCEKTGSLQRMLTISMDYNHIFSVAASVGLFGLFINVKLGEKTGRVLTWLSSMSLGVYLFHENIRLRYFWQPLLGSGKVDGVLSLIWHFLAAVICIFVAGILLEFLRQKMFALLDKVLGFVKPYRALKEKVKKVDSILKQF